MLRAFVCELFNMPFILAFLPILGQFSLVRLYSFDKTRMSLLESTFYSEHNGFCP